MSSGPPPCAFLCVGRFFHGHVLRDSASAQLLAHTEPAIHQATIVIKYPLRIRAQQSIVYGPNLPTDCFCELSFIGTWPLPLFFILSMAVYTLQWPRG